VPGAQLTAVTRSTIQTFETFTAADRKPVHPARKRIQPDPAPTAWQLVPGVAARRLLLA
jgi:hypothetical protein